MQIVRTDEEIEATVKDIKAAVASKYADFSCFYGFAAAGALLLHDWLTDETVRSSPFKHFANPQEEYNEDADVQI
ncbi:MAG: hypothetical protein R3Y11_08460 [Pseudomonadota bacterium]